MWRFVTKEKGKPVGFALNQEVDCGFQQLAPQAYHPPMVCPMITFLNVIAGLQYFNTNIVPIIEYSGIYK